MSLNSSGSGTFTDTTATVTYRNYRASITSAPQQFSCNTVGYVDLIMPAMNSMIANQLNNPAGNTVAGVFSSAPNGTTIYKWNETTQQYDTNTYVSGFGWSAPTMTLAPGEGVFINAGVVWTNTLTGEVPLGYRVSATLAGLSLRSSTVPQAGRVTTDLGLPALDGDTIYRLVNGAYVSFSYSNSSAAWLPSEPSMAVGESFWISRSAALNWPRNFLIWK